MDRMFMNLKKKLTQVILYWGYIHVYDLYSQTTVFVFMYIQISGERLQEHWSSVFYLFIARVAILVM